MRRLGKMKPRKLEESDFLKRFFHQDFRINGADYFVPVKLEEDEMVMGYIFSDMFKDGLLISLPNKNWEPYADESLKKNNNLSTPY